MIDPQEILERHFERPNPDSATAQALELLAAEYPEAHQLLTRIYRDGKTQRWLASRGEHGSRITIGRHVAEGSAFLHGALIGITGRPRR